MRKIYILRGAPASGKSTFIKKHNLTNYTLSSDDIRLKFSSFNYDLDGRREISKNYEANTWKLLKELTEIRLSNGSLTFIDATNTENKDIKPFIILAEKYNYELIVINFELPLEDLIIRNRGRDDFRICPDDVIKKFYSRLSNPLDPKIKQISSEDFLKDFKPSAIEDYSKYKKIIFIGDIQGCFESLNNYFKKRPFNDEYLYIFTGDLLDRGVENHLVIRFINTLTDKENVIFIQGNHERHLEKWVNNEKAKSKIFNEKTAPQLEQNGINKKDISILCKMMKPYKLFNYHDKYFVVSHAGLPFFPNEEQLISMNDLNFINGIGNYNDDIDDIFNRRCRPNQFQVHGHRNMQGHPIIKGNSFNLEGRVEFGGELRILEVSEHDMVELYEKQNIIDVNIKKRENMSFIDRLRSNTMILEKDLGEGVSSFNFKRKVFYDKLWCENTIKARGLFLNNKTGAIIARSYDKFFNINELKETMMSELKKNLKFPLTAYKKENGFLGIASYYNNKPFIASKSTNKSDFAQWFANLMYNQVNMDFFEKKSKAGFSFVFEVIDIKNDPHIIEYSQSKLILLDVIYNNEKFSKLDYKALKSIAQSLNVECKEIERNFENWEEFESWYDTIKEDNSIELEGYVLEDVNGYCFKIKLPFYNFWKNIRTIKDRILKGKEIKFNDDKNQKVIQIIKEMSQSELETDVINIRKNILNRIKNS